MHRLARKLWLAAIVVATSFATSSPASAQFAIGDVFASVGNGLVRVYGQDGTLKMSLNAGGTGFTTGGAFDDAGNFYVTNFSLNRIYVFDNNGVAVTNWATGGANPESIVFNAAGEMYVGHAGNTTFRRFTTDGTLVSTHTVSTENRGTDWIDLGADQSTMFYTSEGGRIARFNVATNTQMADFANIGGVSYALRLLGGGSGEDGVLVANSSTVKRLDGTGAVVQSYDVAGHDGWFALNLDPDGTSFWSGDMNTGQLHKFDVSSGALLASINTGAAGNLFGVSVYGELTSGDPDPEVVPEPISMVLLGTGLLGVGAVARRRKTYPGNSI